MAGRYSCRATTRWARNCCNCGAMTHSAASACAWLSTTGRPSSVALHDVPAPAKINLFLHVTGRRPDGYHLLETAFRFIDLCVVLSFVLRRDGAIEWE